VEAIIDWLGRLGPGIVIVIGGLFAFVQWLDQRKRELSERRFEQYWKLLDTSQKDPRIAHQKISLLLLKRYPEFKDETLHFLMYADVAPDTYPVALRVWQLPSWTVGAMGQGAEPSASAAPWPDCGEKFAA
jgi:hypothetical protein